MEKGALEILVHSIADLLEAAELRLSAAESCTGGWISTLCTDLPGSSGWFECGFVTYSNESKQEMLEVSDLTLDTYGAVSEEIAAEMVRGAIANSRADVAVSVTGIAGPGGATEDKPVGMVCFGWLVPALGVKTSTMYFDGDRKSVRRQSVEHSLQVLSDLLS
uniref:Damage-inducible protein CinA n=1 Tax=uncultured Thiotrichaceae bacterium TaxID=298394 RepID=A0A6S6U001_9GAMM|nr:MAG: Damage-inducible protein CinA [uncultured Thiotrichaceae bacterium]